MHRDHGWSAGSFRMVLAVEACGHDIETVEDIERKQHPLIEAYADHNAMQVVTAPPDS